MSVPSTTERPSLGTDADAQSTDSRSRLPRLASTDLFRPLEALAFWGAIALPFLYVPLLFAGLQTVQELAVFFALLGLNVIALVAGHRHKRE